MSDTNEIRELVTLPIIRVSEYYDEVAERASDDYDPYDYIENKEEATLPDEQTLLSWEWE